MLSFDYKIIISCNVIFNKLATIQDIENVSNDASLDITSSNHTIEMGTINKDKQ